MGAAVDCARGRSAGCWAGGIRGRGGRSCCSPEAGRWRPGLRRGDRAVGELRRLRGRLRAEWWALVAGLVLAVLGASVRAGRRGGGRGAAAAAGCGGPGRRGGRGSGAGDAVIALCGGAGR